MKRWTEFAQMLGLELNEEFRIKQRDEVYEELYRFTEDGLEWYDEKNSNWRTTSGEVEVMDFLDGYSEIIKKPWKPKDNEEYWAYFSNNERATNFLWKGYYIDFSLWKAGNCFKTEAEAETKGKELLEAIVREYEDDK